MRHLTINLRSTVLGCRRRARAAGSDGPRRQVERPRRDRSAARGQHGCSRSKTAAIAPRPASSPHRFSRSKPSSTISARARSSIRRRRARCRSCPRSSKRARPAAPPRPNSAIAEIAAAAMSIAGKHLRRAARPAAAASKAGCATCGATSSGGSAGERDAVDLAGARLADRHLRRPQRSVHRRARRSTRASTSPPTKASRSTRRPTARSNRPPTPATTATSIVAQARLRAVDALRPPERVRGEAGPDGASAATSSATSAPPAARPASHLHYEILANGKLINPLQLLTQPANR